MRASKIRLSGTSTLPAVDILDAQSASEPRGPLTFPGRAAAWPSEQLCKPGQVYTRIGIIGSMDDGAVKAVRWIGSSRRDLKTFPKAVQRDIGQALYAAQLGAEYSSVKALKGFGGRSVLEIMSEDSAATYRAVYTVRFPDAIYVLHAFQKKSKKGIATPSKEIQLIRQRLLMAERAFKERQN
jgi:phage-related protein